MDAAVTEVEPTPPGPTPAGARPQRARGALAGLLGAATALVAIELVSLADSTHPSATTAVQNRFVERFAGSLREVAVSWFGTNDKLALQVGTWLVVLLLGAIVGAVAAGRRAVVLAVFAGFALVGLAAAFDDPLASEALAVVAVLVGAVAGATVTLVLDRVWRAPDGGRPGADPSLAPVSRRTVLVSGGATAAALALGAGIARAGRSSLRQARVVASRAVPRASREVAAPASQPFEVDGITPYITSRSDFYRIDTAPSEAPVVDADTWKLRITGRVDRERTYTYAELLARPDLIEVPVTLQCVSNEVGGELVGTARWTGVPLATLLREAGVHPDADQVMSESVDGFTAGFPTKVALDGRDAMVAIGMNGRSLPVPHGYPARLVVPGLYGYVSATKWLAEIRLTTFRDEEGFWIPRGWSRLGPIKTQARIDVPRWGDEVPAGPVPVAGVAWAPHVGIDKVEVQVDDGAWQEADLGRVASVDTWVQWRWLWDAPTGDHRLTVRATDRRGRVQTAQVAPPAPDGATGRHEVDVTVS